MSDISTMFKHRDGTCELCEKECDCEVQSFKCRCYPKTKYGSAVAYDTVFNIHLCDSCHKVATYSLANVTIKLCGWDWWSVFDGLTDVIEDTCIPESKL